MTFLHSETHALQSETHALHSETHVLHSETSVQLYIGIHRPSVCITMASHLV